VRGYDAEEKFHHFRVGRKSTGSTPSSPVATSRAVAA
jgi:hypothetical protein